MKFFTVIIVLLTVPSSVKAQISLSELITPPDSELHCMDFGELITEAPYNREIQMSFVYQILLEGMLARSKSDIQYETHVSGMTDSACSITTTLSSETASYSQVYLLEKRPDNAVFFGLNICAEYPEILEIDFSEAFQHYLKGSVTSAFVDFESQSDQMEKLGNPQSDNELAKKLSVSIKSVVEGMSRTDVIHLHGRPDLSSNRLDGVVYHYYSLDDSPWEGAQISISRNGFVTSADYY